MHDKIKIKNSFIWSAIDSLGSQALALVVSLILANILGPSIFGLVAMLTIFMAIANVLVNGGFNVALIRKLDRTEADFTTTFCFSFVNIAFHKITTWRIHGKKWIKSWGQI